MALQWTQKGTLKGPKGDTGPAGANGAQGSGFRMVNIDIEGGATVSFDNINPVAGIQTGDLLVDTQGDVFAVASVNSSDVTVGSASTINIRGPQGIQGIQGEKGKDGADGTSVTILGSYDDEEALKDAHPSGDLGDAYIVDGDLYVWDGTEWKNVGSIEGPQGPKGDQGEKGDTGEQGPQGLKGDTGPVGPGVSVGSGTPVSVGTVGECYIDIDTGNLYRYEESV